MELSDNSNQNLPNFISECKERLKKILERLEWTEDKVKKNFNSNSLAYKPNQATKVVQQPKKPEYPDSCFSQNCLVLDTAKLRELLQDNEVVPPLNFQELQANFNREQKLKIYQHVIENTQKLENNLEILEPEGELSLADIVAQKKREENRKKRKFRKSKPTHIEEVRGLVELQMQALKQFMDNRNELTETAKKTSKREEFRDSYGNRKHKSRKAESRVYAKEFGSSYSKELPKTCEGYAQSHCKDSESANRRQRSRSPAKESHHSSYKSQKRSRERLCCDRRYSKELNYKRRRRSRSSSYDRHLSYQKRKQFESHRSKISRSRSPNHDSCRSRYRETKHRNSPESSKRKRRSNSREKAYKKMDFTLQRSDEECRNSRDHNVYSSKNRSNSNQDSLNDYQTKGDIYCKKSSKHKHAKEKKKKHKRDHS